MKIKQEQKYVHEKISTEKWIERQSMKKILKLQGHMKSRNMPKYAGNV